MRLNCPEPRGDQLILDQSSIDPLEDARSAAHQAPSIVHPDLNQDATWFKGTTSLEESAKEKSLWLSGKGTMVLSNGDVIQNGRRFRNGDAQMANALTPLSPSLTLCLKALKSYIPLPVFDETFLLRDQSAWSTRALKLDKKDSEESRMYGGDGPIEELTMPYNMWEDSIDLLQLHLIATG